MGACPVCSGELAHGELILVCARCHDRLGGGVQIGATGEFRVPHDVLEDLAEPAAPVPDATRTCSWCGKAAEQVRKLLGTGAVAICDECVSLCADIMEAELGPDWR